MSGTSKPTSVPHDMTVSELADRILDGIGGTQQSFARWALSELTDRYYRLTSEDYSLMPKDQYLRLKEMEEAARAFWATEAASRYQPCQELRWLWNTLSPDYKAMP